MKFVFSNLELKAPPKKTILNEIETIPLYTWKWDPYLGSYVLPVYTYQGSGMCSWQEKKQGINSHSQDLNWTRKFNLPILSRYIEDHLFSWMEQPGRVNILATPEKTNMNIHYDCRKGSQYQARPKLRVILNGSTSDIFFLNSRSKNHRTHAPSVDSAFIIDGSWPHGVVNTSKGMRVTIAIGSPWEGHRDFIPKLGSQNLLKEHISIPYYSEYFLDKYFSIDSDKLDRLLQSSLYFHTRIGAERIKASFLRNKDWLRDHYLRRTAP